MDAALLSQQALQRLDQLLICEPSDLLGLFMQCKHAILRLLFSCVARGFSSPLKPAYGTNRI